ncbi:hypothetical protein [Novosphingobium olei]|uniref:hypothetical protein n=1 Tax=Novosphingobium olei TaxID=2728851 RepID=UPI0030874AF2|nr:hypothetical protein NSDW_11940 [Novosphingobium olei]
MRPVVGLVWYRRADYRRVLEVMLDAENLPRTFDKWQGQAERAETDFKRRGHATVRAYVDPNDFVAWCAATGHQVDAKGRNAWANLAARRHQIGEN